MKTLKGINLGLSFALEIAMLAAFAYWIWGLKLSLAVRVTIDILLPLALVVGWGAVLAPRAKRRLPMPWLFITKTSLFAASAAALYAAGSAGGAIVLAALIAVNAALVVAWSQY